MIGPYTIHREINNKDLIIKAVIMIDPIMGRFEIMQYDNKCVIIITNFLFH